LSNTLKKRLDEKDIQAETFAEDIDAQKTRQDELRTEQDEQFRILEAKHSEL
jgi:hypothetical protein